MRRHVVWLCVLVASLAAFAACFIATGGDFAALLRVNEPFNEIADVALGEDGRMAVIDTYRTRLLLLDADGRLIREERAAEGVEFYHPIVRGGDAYVVKQREGQEAALGIAFDPATGEALPIARGDIPQGDAPWKVIAAPSGQTFMLEYSGKIWNLSTGELLLDPDEADWGERCIPGGIAVDDRGTLWIVNLGSRRIGTVTGGVFTPVFSQEDVIAQGYVDVDNTGFYTLAMSGGAIATAVGDRLVLRAEGGLVRSWAAASLPPLTLALKALALLAALAFAVSLLRFVGVGLKGLRGAHLSALTGQAVQFVVFVLIFGVAVGYNFILSYQTQFSISRESWLRQTALLGAVDITQSGALDPGGSGKAGAQQQLNAKLRQIAAQAQDEIEATVVVVEADSIRVLAQTHEEVPLYYPLRTDLRSEREDGLSYRAAVESSTIRFGVVEDARGRWETCLCPIFGEDGAVVALLDVRVDADQFSKENRGLIVETVLSAASTVVVVLFFFIEINRMMAVMMDRPRPGESARGHRRPLVRWLGFLTYTAFNIPMFFIPLQAAAIFDAGAPAFLTRGVAVAMPLTLNMLGMAIASTACASLVERRGWKPGALAGIILCAAGYALAMLYENILWYVGMMFVAGLGAGLIALSLQTFIFASAPDGDTQSDRLLSLLNSGMYAGANCGVIFGSLLADRLGYLAAFIAAVAVFALAAVCVARMLGNAAVAPHGGEGGGLSAIRFLMNGRVLAFLVLMLVPVTVLGFFVAHFLPIFADMNGVSSTIASWGYLLNGIAIIYLGPILTRALLRRVGGRAAVLITSLTALAGIAIFAAAPVIPAAFLSSMLLGLADAGGQVSRQEEFLQLPQSRRAGASRALSSFSLFENIGQTVGPGVFSLIVAVGVQPGMLALTAVTAACIALYALSSGRRKAAPEVSASGADTE